MNTTIDEEEPIPDYYRPLRYQGWEDLLDLLQALGLLETTYECP